MAVQSAGWAVGRRYGGAGWAVGRSYGGAECRVGYRQEVWGAECRVGCSSDLVFDCHFPFTGMSRKLTSTPQCRMSLWSLRRWERLKCATQKALTMP